MYRIGVESSLSRFQEGLREQGYEVVNLETIGTNEEDLNDYDAVIISGQDLNFMGMENRVTQVPVINASGLNQNELLEELEARLEKEQ